MSRSEYLDRTEKFVEYLETKRKQAGLMQKQLADLGGISHSYYTKLIGLRRARQRCGDESDKLTVPLAPTESLRRILEVLSERTGEDCVTEGMRLWGHYHPESEPKETRDLAAKALVELWNKLQQLTTAELRTISDTVDHLLH